MKTTILLVFLIFCSVVSFSQNIYYVQDKAYNDNASDMNKGTDINYPWATWQKAFNTAQAGDTVYFRGGVWYPTTKAQQGYGITYISPSEGFGHNGTHDKPICFFAYPPDYKAQNFPILDGNYASQSTTGNLMVAIGGGATNIKFKGLTVRNARMLNAIHNCGGFGATEFGNLYFENCIAHNNGGVGFTARTYDTVYFINCDSYNNCDSLDIVSPGGDGDGFIATSRGLGTDTLKYTYLSGCRSWRNSDDGFDIGTTKQLYIDSCWSWRNGKLDGDGSGFKFAYSAVLNINNRKVQNCITAYNHHANEESGFGYGDVNLNDEHFGPRMLFYNNSSYKDYVGFTSALGSGFVCGESLAHVIYRNNLVYAATNASSTQAFFGACKYLYPTYVTQDHNTWVQGELAEAYTNKAYTVNDDDFVSLDTAQLRWPRKPDGSLPDITFLRLKNGSDLIDAGVDHDLAYYGSAPDIGAFECDTFPGTNNKYPSVAITSPSNNSTITSDDNIIKAQASDADGSIKTVEFFYEDTILIGEATMYPWSCSWDKAPFGNHSLRVVATDNLNAKSTSLPVNVTVIPGDVKNIGNAALFPNPNEGSFTLFLASPLKKSSDVTILSIEGKIIYKGKMAAEERVKVFNLSTVRPGLYVLMLSSPEIFLVQKFIKE